VAPEGQPAGCLRVRKTLLLDGDESALKITYDIRNEGNEALSGIFSPEFAINLLTGGSPDRYYHSEDRDLERPMLGVHGMEASLRHLCLRDEWQRLETGFRVPLATGFCFFPLETISQSECGQERVHQGCVVFPRWPLNLEAGEVAVRELTWYVRCLDAARDR